MSDIEQNILFIRWLELMNALYRLIREIDPDATNLPYPPRQNTPLQIAYDIAELLGKGLIPE